MTQDVLPERVHREYREVPDGAFDLDSIIRRGRVRGRRRRAAQASGLVAAVAAGVFAVGPGLGLMGQWSTLGQAQISGDPDAANASKGCLTAADLARCEGQIRRWSEEAGWDASDRKFQQHPAFSPGSFYLASERDRADSTTIRDFVQVVVTRGPQEGVQAHLEPLPGAGNLQLSDGSVAEIRDSGGSQHLREIFLPAGPGRAGVLVTINSNVPASKTPTSQPETTTPLPAGWDEQARRLLEVLIARG